VTVPAPKQNGLAPAYLLTQELSAGPAHSSIDPKATDGKSREAGSSAGPASPDKSTFSVELVSFMREAPTPDRWIATVLVPSLEAAYFPGTECAE